MKVEKRAGMRLKSRGDGAWQEREGQGWHGHVADIGRESRPG